MPARVIQNSQNGKNSENKQSGASKMQIKAPAIKEKSKSNVEVAQLQEAIDLSGVDRAQFYAGQERLDLQGNSVQRVRDLQEQNDHLQREITSKENDIGMGDDPLTSLAEIEHRKILIARNTGEILKIYTRNEERMKRIQELETHNARIQKELKDMQGKFIWTKDMDEKTKFASEFFILKSEIEKNLSEINELNQK